MIKESIDDLYKAIETSEEYKNYLKIGEILEKDKEINNLINEIKRLQQKSVKLEYNSDSSYKIIDKEIKEKVSKLNKMPLYKEYLRRMSIFNNILSESSNNIEQYINSKI